MHDGVDIILTNQPTVWHFAALAAIGQVVALPAVRIEK